MRGFFLTTTINPVPAGLADSSSSIGGNPTASARRQLNAIRGPDINNFDLSLFRNIAPRDGIRLQWGAEFFNLFNHPQFDGAGTGIGSPTFGVITDARDPRVTQLRVKFSF